MVSLTNFRSVADLVDTQPQPQVIETKPTTDNHQPPIPSNTTTPTTAATAPAPNIQHQQQQLQASEIINLNNNFISTNNNNNNNNNGGKKRAIQTLDQQQRQILSTPTSNPLVADKMPLFGHKTYHLQQLDTIQPQQPLATISSKPPTNGAHSYASSAALGNQHFEIRWDNLSYHVEPKWYQQSWRRQQTTATTTTTSTDHQQNSNQQQQANRTCILNQLNGSIKSGQVTAILGPSGAGKTSLLGCLTGKNKSGVSGSIQVISGREKPMSICIIPQKDYLLNQLTIRENLWFASRLKNPMDNFDHESNIERVVDLLKLESCIDTKISKVSGGQYKRVSIAQELLSNPDILILDEPTSGLDSLTCYKTVMVLRDLAKLSPNPMAILVTIHQPQREVFDLFNHVYILAIGGRCIYEGQPAHSIKTINECSGGLHFDAGQYNPASYLVEIASAEFGDKPIEALVQHQRGDHRRRMALANQQQQLAAAQLNGDQILIGEPRSSRQSPIVARLKSTLSSLTGGASGGAGGANNYHQQQQQQQQQLYAYTNEAYDISQVAGAGGGGDDGLINRQAPSYFEISLENNPKQPTSMNHNNNESPKQQQQQQQHQRVVETHYDNKNKNNHDNDNDEFYLDHRLQTHKHNHNGHFLRHCQLLTKRSWLCLCKDPMLTTLRFSAHIIVPLLITLVYGSRVGQPNACPLYESEMDLIDYARRGAKRLLNLQDELRCTFENVGLYFLSVYAFTFSTMCLTSLSFPLNMHVLLKEVRNGWYSIPTYFIGKTLADFPLEFILPTVTLMITYPLTGQPSSYLEWRFLLATGVFVVTSLIAQTQGLIFGALFMNAMQAAVFVAPVSTTPLILLSGFLIRISQMPAYLQKLSAFSYFRHAIESLTIIRYGFNQCPCDPLVVNGRPVSAKGVPDQLKTMTNYWLSTFDEPTADDNSINGSAAVGLGSTTDYLSSLNETALSDYLMTTTVSPTSLALASDVTTTAAAAAATTTLETFTTTAEPPIDFFQDLTSLLARANSFGADIRTCKDLKPYPMIDFSLDESQLYVWVFALIATLFVSKVVNYLVVKYSVKWRL